MPFYHRKYGEFGRRNTRQVTTKWMKMKKLESLEKQAKAKLKRVEKMQERREERARRAVTRAQNAAIDSERKRKDEERRISTLARMDQNRAVCAARVERLESWGRENVERKNRMREELAERKRQEEEKRNKEAEREHQEAKTMAREEHLMWLHLEYIRELPEQVMMRRYGTLESTVFVKERADGHGEGGAAANQASRARQNLHMLEFFLIQPERNDDVAEWEEAPPPLPKTLNLDLTQFPNAVDIKAKELGAYGARLLCNQLAPPPPKTSAFRDDSLAPISAPNLMHIKFVSSGTKKLLRMGARALAGALQREAMPRLKTLDLCGNDIEDAGLKAILDAVDKKPKALRHLKVLRLRRNMIGDSGALALAHSLLQSNLPSVVEIDLKMNQIRSKGAHGLMSHLDATTRHKYFRLLNLSGNLVDRRKLKRFAELQPKWAVL